jgi:uncharacterized protein YgfB (UPF0149 family)
MMLYMGNFVAISQAFVDAKSSLDICEIHGFLSGVLSAGAQMDSAQLTAAFQEHFDCSLSSTMDELVIQLSFQAGLELDDPEMGFDLLLPEDDVTTGERGQGLYKWCQGFLSGFGITGRYQDSELSDEVREVLTDLAKISALDVEVPNSDENDGDLIEIIEYVRMSAIMIYLESAKKSVH